MVLPGAAIDHIIQGIRKVHSADSLEQLFRAANFDIDSGVIPDGRASIPSLYRFIQEALIQSAHLEESRDNPTGGCTDRRATSSSPSKPDPHRNQSDSERSSRSVSSPCTRHPAGRPHSNPPAEEPPEAHTETLTPWTPTFAHSTSPPLRCRPHHPSATITTPLRRCAFPSQKACPTDRSLVTRKALGSLKMSLGVCCMVG